MFRGNDVSVDSTLLQILLILFVLFSYSDYLTIMSTRRRAREIALQVLYQFDLNPSAISVDYKPFLYARLQEPASVIFSKALVEGVSTHKQQIDNVLDQRSEHWRGNRMATTDRAVLRLAVFELACSDTPGPVVVDEGIELARRYGSAHSAPFVSGILGRCLDDREILQKELQGNEHPADA
ncbi:MAG: transcription antitermination factor NusB [Planctomycetaceae bacterium]|nr:transcription antitermination factor NusB [Planctomycetaceae bacterium]